MNTENATVTADLEEVISHMVTDKLSMVPFGQLLIIAKGSKEAERVEKSDIHFAIINTKFGDYISVPKNSLPIINN